jgi:DNA-binding CsgD family transcriptional regulator
VGQALQIIAALVRASRFRKCAGWLSFCTVLKAVPVYRRRGMGDLAMWQPQDKPALTSLQREIIIFVTNGLTNREIAARLDTTPGRVGTLVGRIVQRLGLTRRVEIAAWVAWVAWADSAHRALLTTNEAR